MREGLVLNLKSNSSDILRWDMGVMFARSYVLQLSDNVKRSKEQAVKNGSWIGLAPLGYIHILDEKGEKNIVPDPERTLLLPSYSSCMPPETILFSSSRKRPNKWVYGPKKDKRSLNRKSSLSLRILFIVG